MRKRRRKSNLRKTFHIDEQCALPGLRPQSAKSPKHQLPASATLQIGAWQFRLFRIVHVAGRQAVFLEIALVIFLGLPE